MCCEPSKPLQKFLQAACHRDLKITSSVKNVVCFKHVGSDAFLRDIEITRPRSSLENLILNAFELCLLNICAIGHLPYDFRSMARRGVEYLSVCSFCWCCILLLLLLLFYPSSWDGGMAQTAIQVHAINLIELGQGKSGSPFQTSRGCKLWTGSPTTNKADCHWWVPKSRLLRQCWVSSFIILTR